MNPFAYTRAAELSEAVRVAAQEPTASFVAGGTNLVDLMKANVAHPTRLVDLTRLPMRTIEETPGGGLRLGALVTNAVTAYDPRVVARYPLIAQAILAGASPQLRNMATNGGNLLQRTRCYYFYERSTACNKREPGSGCDALQGYNRIHAILGASPSCVAVHPSDFCVALAALEAIVHVTGVDGERTIAFEDFHRLPGDTPERDHVLRAGDVITAIELPAPSFTEHVHYLKVRDRKSYAFALVSVAAALTLDAQGAIADARLALGGVAHKPWRSKPAEALLRGLPPNAESFAKAADVILEGAQPLEHNVSSTPSAVTAAPACSPPPSVSFRSSRPPTRSISKPPPSPISKPPCPRARSPRKNSPPPTSPVSPPTTKKARS